MREGQTAISPQAFSRVAIAAEFVGAVRGGTVAVTGLNECHGLTTTELGLDRPPRISNQQGHLVNGRAALGATMVGDQGLLASMDNNTRLGIGDLHQLIRTTLSTRSQTLGPIAARDPFDCHQIGGHPQILDIVIAVPDISHSLIGEAHRVIEARPYKFNFARTFLVALDK